jgi:hypothetical protein
VFLIYTKYFADTECTPRAGGVGQCLVKLIFNISELGISHLTDLKSAAILPHEL